MNDDTRKEDTPEGRHSSILLPQEQSESGLISEADRQLVVDAVDTHKVWLETQKNLLRAEERSVPAAHRGKV